MEKINSSDATIKSTGETWKQRYVVNNAYKKPKGSEHCAIDFLRLSLASSPCYTMKTPKHTSAILRTKRNQRIIVIPYESLDLWHPLGTFVNGTKQFSFLIEGTTRCDALYPQSNTDVPGLKQILQITLEKMIEWVENSVETAEALDKIVETLERSKGQPLKQRSLGFSLSALKFLREDKYLKLENENDEPVANTFAQLVDHFIAPDNRTFAQKYYFNDACYKPGGPLFLYIGGEGELGNDILYKEDNLLVQYAKKVNAGFYGLEHRFYGQSHSTRQKYPQLTGTIGSSGPVEAKVDFFEYLQVVENSTIECHNKIRLNGSTNIVESIEPLNEMLLYKHFYYQFAVTALYGEDIAGLCELWNNDTIDVLDKSPQEEIELYFDGYIKLLNDTSYSGCELTNQQWNWQVCNEFSFFQTSDIGYNMFGSGLPITLYISVVMALTAPLHAKRSKPTSRKLKDIMVEPEATTNHLHIQGTVDPWNFLGFYTDNEDHGEDVRTFLVDGTSHCADLLPETSEDPEGLKEARKLNLQTTKRRIA